MASTDEKTTAEARFRELLEGAGLPQPDRVVHEDDEVWCYFDETKTALCIELHDRRSAAPPHLLDADGQYALDALLDGTDADVDELTARRRKAVETYQPLWDPPAAA